MDDSQNPALTRHDRHTELARLATDVYDSAAGTGQPPSGWIRASENLAQLRSTYPALAAIATETDLRELFAPNKLGVRAELYLPDPTIQPPGTAPVLAFKGTNGEIRVQDPTVEGGVRRVESSISDWANNLIQGTGGESPDYTHAMRVAETLRAGGLEFQVTGHSKGGGIGAAAATVTGMEAVVFNPAGVHPETTARFLRANSSATPGDPNQLVTTYKVEGEVLNAGAQDFTAGMSAQSKRQLADVIQEVARTGRTVPGFDDQLRASLRSANVDAVTTDRTLATVHRLAGADTRQLLDQFPTAGGRLEPALRPMERSADGQLVERHGHTLPSTAPTLSPVLSALDDIARAARVGRGLGTAVESGVSLGARGVDTAGDAVRVGADAGAIAMDEGARRAGLATSATIRGGGEVAATGRQLGGEIHGRAIESGAAVSAKFQQVSAERARTLAAIPFMPEYAQRWLNRNADELDQSATSTLVDAQRRALSARQLGQTDAAEIRLGTQALAGSAAERVTQSTNGAERALREAGTKVDRGLEGTAQSMRDAAAYFPATGAAALGSVEAGRQVAVNPALMPYAGIMLQRVQDGAGESVHRHGMGVVLDSLEQRRREIEDATRERTAPAPATTSTPRDPAQDGHPRQMLFRSIEDGVHAIDARLGRTPDGASRNLSYALYAEAASSGWRDVGGVVLGQKTDRMTAGEQTFAFRGTPERPEDWVSVRTAQAVQTPSEASLTRAEQLEHAQQREQGHRAHAETMRGPALS